MKLILEIIPTPKNNYMPNIFSYSLLILSAIFLFSCGTSKNASSGKGVKSNITPEAQVKVMTMFIDASMKQAQGYHSESINEYLQVIRFAPNHAPSHFNVAKIYFENLNNAEKALEFAQNALRLDDNNVFYYELSAQILIKLNKNEEAVSLLQRGVKKFPNETDLQAQLVDALMKAAKYDDAIGVLNKLETKSGMMIQAVNQKRDIYRFQKKYDLAILETNKLINSTRDNAQYYYDLHDLYLAQGKQMEAMKTLETLLSTHPNDPVANFKLVDYYNLTGNQPKAQELMYKNFDNPHLNLDAKVSFLIRAIQSPGFQQNSGMIKSMISKLHQQNPKSGLVSSLRGDVYASLGKLDSARYYFKQAVLLDDSNPKVWEAILRIDAQLEMSDSLMKDSEQAMETFPNNPMVVYYNGIAHYQKKDYRNAARIMEKFTKFEVSDPVMLTQAYSLLGESYHRLNEYVKSDKAYESGLAVDPNNLTILNNYAYYLSLRKEKLDYALSLSEKTVKLMPNSATYLDTYGWILFQLGRYQEAQTYIQKAYHIAPSADIADHLGDVLFRLGETDRAVELWKEAKTKGVGNLLIDQKINNRKL